MTNLIWTSTTFKDRTSLVACNGTKGVYEMRETLTGLGKAIVVMLNDSAISEPFYDRQSAADMAQANDNGWFDEDHYDNGGRPTHE